MPSFKKFNEATQKWEPIGGVPIDKTLTNVNTAAEAKAVGDKLATKIGISGHNAGKVLGADDSGNIIDKDIIVRQNTEPTDKNVLWIDTNDDTNPAQIVVDPTLSVSGHAADAKIVGDEINKYKTAVLFTPQELTPEQQKQARKNIGADGGTGGPLAALTFTGASTAEYDGTKPVTVDIPEGLTLPGAQVGDLARVKALGPDGQPSEWEPVTMEELEGKWEEIELIESVGAEILRDAEPDGTKYNFTAVRIIAEYPEGSESNPFKCYVNNAPIVYSNLPGTQHNAIVEMSCKRGRIESNWFATNNPGTDGTWKSTTWKTALQKIDRIETIKITKAPAGATFQIEAVRA